MREHAQSTNYFLRSYCSNFKKIVNSRKIRKKQKIVLNISSSFSE
jgi:hypothetical protein